MEVDPTGVTAPPTRMRSIIFNLGSKLLNGYYREKIQWPHHRLGGWLMDRAWGDEYDK